MQIPKHVKYLYLFVLLALVASCSHEDEKPAKDKDAENSLVISNELSNKHVTTMVEDSRGYIWIGTFRGLNRYDGHEYHQYFCTDDSTGLQDNQIKSLFVDSKDRLWVGTINGPCLYMSNDQFQRVPIPKGSKNCLKFLEDRKGRIFIYNNNELLMYDETDKLFKIVISNLDKRNQFTGNIFVDEMGDIWSVGANYICRYSGNNFKQNKMVPLDGYYFFSHLNNDGTIILSGYGQLVAYNTHNHQMAAINESLKQGITANGGIISAVTTMENGEQLIATDRNGAFLFRPSDNSVLRQTDGQFPFEMPSGSVSDLLYDSHKNLWMGTSDKGIEAEYYYEERFNYNRSINRAIGNNSVSAVVVDKHGVLWASAPTKGIYAITLSPATVKQVDIQGLSEIEKNQGFAHMLVDRDNYLWLSTGSSVVRCLYDGTLLRVVDYYILSGVMDIQQANDGTIWIANFTNTLYSVTPGEKMLHPRQVYNGYTFIPSLLPLHNGGILIAAFNQKLLLMNTASKKTSEITISPDDRKACIRRSAFIPVKAFEDTKGQVWIGTVSNGLIKYTPRTNRAEHVAGISCSDISSMEEDNQGNIWISTLKGLNKLDISNGKMTSFYMTDGLGGDEFNDRASCRMPDGQLVFGGLHGLTYFNPIDISLRKQIPLYLQNLKVHNQLVRPRKEGEIETTLDSCKRIVLDYNENSFSLSYCALDYSQFERVHYYYQMEGYDKDWIDAGNAHVASYANVPAGHYTFKVKITASDSQTTLGQTQVEVIVRSAPWRSWWAWIIYVLLAVLIIRQIYVVRKRLTRAREEAREIELEKEQEQRTNKMNMSFFANIAHEFRTPLTMISGPVAQLAQSGNVGNNERHLLSIAQHSIQRMFKLVNQLMDFNKLENDTLWLNVSEMDVVNALNTICDDFEFNARQKKMSIHRYGMEDRLFAWTDSDKLEKIVSNLMSNALKYTPAGGSIDVSLDVITRDEAKQILSISNDDSCQQYVKISVADTGKGIPEDQLENIFKRYYQLDNQTKAVINWGTGIGLYYSRRLAELHHGYLKAFNRREMQGSEFVFIYPLNRDMYSADECRPIEEGQRYVAPVDSLVQVSSNEQPTNEDHRPTILVVDDDTEIISYMQTLLSSQYRVITCLDAEDALSKMREEEPNIVLSDVIMPGKTGYELCREIKQDIQLCHIPVILVTAKITSENQVEGLNVGADAYVTKPFDPNVLLALIKSQLNNRLRVRHILSQSTTATDENVENVLSLQDKQFMEELYQLMEDELANPELDVAHITDLIHISRTKLYYKIKGLTGETPSNFFRTYKLNRAAELIKEGHHTISEISDMTGFSTQSHFSYVFKKHFGVTPTQYK